MTAQPHQQRPTDPPPTLAAALGQLQAGLPVIAKDHVVRGEKYSYAYADLAQITRAVLPMLAPLGLAWITKPTLSGDGRFVLAYSLLHTSGEREDGQYPLNQQGTAQQRGSEISYARRYALCSVLGVAPEADDDGAAASAQQPARRQPASRRREAPTEDQQGEDPAVTPGQIKAIQTGFSGLGYGGTDNRETRLAIVSKMVGREVDSTSNLTAAEAKTVLEGIAERRRAQKAPDNA